MWIYTYKIINFNLGT